MRWPGLTSTPFQDINPATLTGAIDVIVVERPTESGEVELACSPFHVRFGKLSVLRPIDKKVSLYFMLLHSRRGKHLILTSFLDHPQVRITVNDQSIPFYMKVGETGEAFFVFETDADLPEDMQTSPLAGPIGDDEMEEHRDDDGAPGVR